jgi:amino acid adenylation domain-containing protein
MGIPIGDAEPAAAIAVDYDPFADGELIAAMTPTASQEEIWIATKVGGDDANRAFNEALALTLRGPLNQDALEAALRVLSERHESLRCSFTADGQRFTVTSADRMKLARLDLSTLPAEARAADLADVFRREVETPFDLERSPLYRASLIRMEPDRHIFLFCCHHVICDGLSVGVLAHEIAAVYRETARRWPAPTSSADLGLAPAPSFAAYATEMRARNGTDAAKREEAFWLERLAGDIKPIDLPIDRPRPARRTYGARRVDLSFDPALLAPLRKLGAKAGCTFLATFMGAVQVWLHRLTGQRDLVIGVPAAGQAASGAASLVGHCVNVLPIRAEVDPVATFAGHLAALRPVILDAFDNQQVTFSTLLRRLNIAFDASRISLIPVCVNLDTGLGDLDFGGLEVACETLPRAFETFELFINAVDHRDRLVLEWSYNTALFDEATIRRWMRELEVVVADALRRPEATLQQLDVLAPEEKEIFRRLNDTRRPVDGVPVHERVASRAREGPDRTAIRFGGRALSYRDLDRRANQLAQRLRREGVHPRHCVGVSLNRSESLPVALLAVLKCGASYVPMDPSYPADRLAMMAEDAGVRLVVTEHGLLSGLPRVEASVCIDTLRAELGAEPDEPPGVVVAGEDRAYVLFTSGSTGRPKGVEVPHRALENFLASMQRAPGFTEEDRLLAVTTMSFDIAGLELFLPLVTGGTVVIANRSDTADPEALIDLLGSEGITVMQATPATWRMLIDAGWRGRDGLRVLCGGEALTPGLAAELGERARDVWNMYGPTETTIWSTVKRVERGSRVTIGRAIDNTTVYVLDENRAQVPVSSTGEIWIGGAGVALGYVGRPELTRERFIEGAFVPGERAYRTGDLGRVLPDGEIECLGRADSQVKIRGFRVELGEIETAIERVVGVRKSIVQLLQKGQDPQLVAYFVTDAGRTVDVAAIKVALQKALPAYMLPTYHVPLDAWPLTPAGKIDRKALPAPVVGRGDAGMAEGLRDDVDVLIAEIWQELLGVRDVRLTDDFFALGGQSLLAVRFVTMVKAKLGIPFNLATLFVGPSLREVADAVRAGGGQVEKGAIALRREPGAPRVFFICGVHLYRAAAFGLGEGIESYGVIVTADDKLEEALKTNVVPRFEVPPLVQEYLAAVRRVQPHGPYRLAGVSFGGVLAYEVARALQAAGEQVDLLALLDPVLPSSLRRSVVGQLKRMTTADGIRNVSMRVAKTLLGPAQQTSAFGDETPVTNLAALRERAYDNAIAKWDKNPPSYSGDAVLLRAMDKSDFLGMNISHDLGWRRLIQGNLDIHEVPGNHIGILRAPNVQRLAEILRRYVLDAAVAESARRHAQSA